MMREFDLLDECLKIFPERFKSLPEGPGDDCAVITARNSSVISTDSLVENVHFKLSWSNPRDIAWKALAANDSDIAAMGGSTIGYLFSIGVPKGYSEIVKELYQGFLEYFLYKESEFGIVTKLLGGDTVFSDTFFVSITVIGNSANFKGPIFRSGAQPGDLLFLSGAVGYSALGLSYLSGTQKEEFENIEVQKAINIHKRPKAEVILGKYLGELGLATSMIDISDGLIQDAIHICNRSSVSMNIRLDYFSSYLKNLSVLAKLSSGEEYALLFSVRNNKEDTTVLSELLKKFPKVQVIGEIVLQKEEQLFFYLDEKLVPLSDFLKKNNCSYADIGYQHQGF